MGGGASAGEEVGEAGGEERGIVERVVAVHERRVDLHLRRACRVIAIRTAAVNRCVDWLLDCVIAHVRSLEDLLLQRERVPRHPNQPYLPLALEPVERGKSLLDDHVDRRRELGVVHLRRCAASVPRSDVAAGGERCLHRVDVVELQPPQRVEHSLRDTTAQASRRRLRGAVQGWGEHLCSGWRAPGRSSRTRSRTCRAGPCRTGRSSS